MKPFIFSALVVISFPLMAQWTPNTALNTLAANVNTDDMMTAATNDGRTYIAFWAPVSGPTYYEMRLQLLDTSGTPQFGPNGMIVDNSIGMSTSTVTWDLKVDNTNNEPFRHQTMGNEWNNDWSRIQCSASTIEFWRTDCGLLAR